MIMDSRARSWIKSIIWRAVGVVILGTIAYLITGDWEETGVITIIFHAIRTVLYYYHERIWNAISWGREIKEI